MLSEHVWILVKETWIKNLAFLILVILASCFFSNRIPLILGMLIGTAVCMLNFMIVSRTSEALLDRTGNIYFYYGTFYMLRFLFSGLAIFAGIKIGNISIITIMLGLFSIKLTLTFFSVYDIYFKKKECI